jgi:hypothetical protein
LPKKEKEKDYNDILPWSLTFPAREPLLIASSQNPLDHDSG